jgi:hypothetical protein
MSRSIHPMWGSLLNRRRAIIRLRPRPHRLDESAASYSSAGWSPPEPTSASPAGFHVPSAGRNCQLGASRAGESSTGRMGKFQPELTAG